MSDPSSPPSRPATANTTWWWALIVWCLCGALTVAAVWLLCGWNRAMSPTNGTPSFDALSRGARWSLVIATIGGWVAGTWRIARATGRPRTAIAIGVVLVGSSWMGAGATAFVRGRWSEHCRITDASGRTYLVLEQLPYFIDRHIALGRVRDHGWIVESIDILQQGEYGAGDAGDVQLPDGFDRSDGFFFVRRADGGVVAVEHEQAWSTGAVFARTADGEETVADPFVLLTDGATRAGPDPVESSD